MRLFPYSFNGFLFQQNERVASDFDDAYDWNIAGISTTDVPLSQRFPQFAVKSYAGSLKVINTTLLNVDIDRDEIVKAMDVLGEDQHQLIALDELGRSWYVNAVFVGLNEDGTEKKTASFGAIFAVDDVIWKKLVPTQFQILVDGTGSGSTTPKGNQPALPIITITPTGAGAGAPGPAYKKFLQIINNSNNPLVNYPLNLAGTVLDTAALVTDGKLLANGDDLRIFVDGVEIQRWFGGGGINSTTTKIWSNWTQPANANMTLDVAIASSGVISYIKVKNTPLNVARLKKIPNVGLCLIGTEVFAYTGKNITTLRLTGVTRAERLTSMSAHASNATISFIRDVWMYYGYPSSPAYVADDTYKPIIDLVNSTNTSHIYTEFLESTGKRTGKWDKNIISANPFVIYGKHLQSLLYTSPHDTGDVDPAVVIGTRLFGPGNLGWKYYNPCGITHINTTGEKIAINGFFNCTLRAGVNGVNYPQEVYADTPPSVPFVWEAAGSGGTIALGATYYYLYLRSFASPLVASSKFLFQQSELSGATVTVTNAPTINTSVEFSSFPLHSILSNAATGLTMELQLAMKLNTYVVINTKEKTITLYDGTNAINMIVDMPVRPEWFPFLPGEENAISITDDGEVTFAFQYEDRYL